jgi:hypothetical protein
VEGNRDRFVDLLRGASMVLVVLGHWLVCDLVWVDGRLAETSALAEQPGLWPLTWLVAVIPVFFFVGGFSNARSWRGCRRRREGYAAFVDRRTHRVLVPLLVYLAVVVPVGFAVSATSGLGVAVGGVLALQPLWFLGVYLLVVAITPVMLAWHRHWGWAVPVTLLLVAVACDLLRFGGGVAAVGNVNVFVIWLLVHQLGFLYADGRIGPPAAAAMTGLGLGCAVVLTQWDALPYPSTMVGVPGLEQGNMHPPTVAAMALGIGAVGVALMARAVVSGWLRQPRVWRTVVAVNLSVMTIYLWHQVALVVAARIVLPLGYPAPEPGSAGWWTARLLWLLLPAAVLAGIVAVAGRAERITAPPAAPDTRRTRTAAVVAVVVLGVGVLALAGSDVLLTFAVRASGIGPVRIGVLVGLTLVAAAAVALRGLRTGDAGTARAALAAAALLAVVATGYAVGAGPLPVDSSAAAGLGVLAALLGAVPLVPAAGLPAEATPARR